MRRWRATATVTWYFDAEDKAAAQRSFDRQLYGICSNPYASAKYRDEELEELDEEDFATETSEGDA